MATPRSTSTSCSFYGSSSIRSTPGSKGSNGPKPKQQRLSGLNLVKSLQVANGDDDLGIDLSSDDEKSESTNNGGGRTSPQYDPTDFESGEEDPTVGEGLELPFNSSMSMYSFEDPASLTSSQSVSRSSTPAHARANNGAATPQSRLGSSTLPEADRLADILDRQNNLILKLLKHEQLSTSLVEVKNELQETKGTVGRMVQENKATSNKDEKMKRKYPSSLTVSVRYEIPVYHVP